MQVLTKPTTHTGLLTPLPPDRRSAAPKAINLYGDRHIEWSWLAAHLPEAPTDRVPRLLDFGAADSWVHMIAVHRGYDVTIVDLEAHDRPIVEPRVSTIVGDVREASLPADTYDAVFNCSAIEHVGLVGRYGVRAEHETDGDLHAMRVLRRAMRPGGVMLLTIPIGLDALFMPMCRVYGEERLPRLLEGFTVVHGRYWLKNNENRWCGAPREEALRFPCDAGDPDWRRNVYGLGCFVLRK